jgi:hypothetical protein
MWIVMIGDPYTGFNLFGPYAEAEAAEEIAARGDVQASADCCWVFKLNALLDEPHHIEEEDPAGAAVVFAGSVIGDPRIGDGLGFYGPFTDLEAARKWAAEDGLGTDCAIELRPAEELFELVI